MIRRTPKRRRTPDKYIIKRLTIYIPLSILKRIYKLENEIEKDEQCKINRSDLVRVLIEYSLDDIDELFPKIEVFKEAEK